MRGHGRQVRQGTPAQAGKVSMNTKAENVVPATSAGDIAKYVLAAAIAAAGIAVYYLFPQWVAPARAVVVVLGFAGAVAVMAMTALGRRGREFISESLFELRKVVWPSRQDAMRTTGLVLIVVVIISLILALFDKIIEQLIKLLLY
jgi:preprotein translocase subunit SecE